MEAGRDTRCKSKRKKENIMESREEKEESAKKRKEPRKNEKKNFFLLLCLRICLISSIRWSDGVCGGKKCVEEMSWLEVLSCDKFKTKLQSKKYFESFDE